MDREVWSYRVLGGGNNNGNIAPVGEPADPTQAIDRGPDGYWSQGPWDDLFGNIRVALGAPPLWVTDLSHGDPHGWVLLHTEDGRHWLYVGTGDGISWRPAYATSVTVKQAYDTCQEQHARRVSNCDAGQPAPFFAYDYKECRPSGTTYFAYDGTECPPPPPSPFYWTSLRYRYDDGTPG